MGRNINAENIGIIIKALREKNRFTKELVALGVPKEITIRILRDYLQRWGLVEKNHERGERWVWFEHAKKQPWEGTPLTLNFGIKHTQDLLPGLEALLDINSQTMLEERERIFQNPIDPIPFDDDYEVTRRNQLFLSKFAEQHLKTGYPEIYDILVEFRTLDIELTNKTKEAKERALDNFMIKFGALKKKTNDVELVGGKKRENISEIQERRPEWAKNWEELTKNVPYVLGPFQTRKELNEVLKLLEFPSPQPVLVTTWNPAGILKVARYLSRKEPEETNNYLIPGPVEAKISKEDEEIINKCRVLLKQKYGELAKQISMLKWQARNQPLLGQCDICPNILIRE